MLFNSFEFSLFLPIVFFIYWFIFGQYSFVEYASRSIKILQPIAQFFGLWHNNLKIQNAFIVIVSYLFYGWWNWHFLLLIFFTSICSWSSGLLIEKWQNTSKAKWVSVINIILNLSILGFYKYYNFFIESFADIVTSLGGEPHMSTLKIILPVGISFYTFQALSYSIDVYRKKLPATNDIVAFLAFVSFFPQLVAGPIERATNLLPQFLQKRRFDYSLAIDGLFQMLWGFFKKIVIADTCAIYVDKIWLNYADQSSGALLVAAILFSFQIYGDFSGYSDIAIGTGKLFGIQLMENFSLPYFSRNIGEFWRRWHISLTTWFKDYLYIPLGGSRGGKWFTVRNTFIIFLVSGFWHGANWTYVTWGLFHVILFMPSLLFGKNRKYVNTPIAEGRILPSINDFLHILLTFTLVTIGWILFRAPSIHDAISYINSICNIESLKLFKISIIPIVETRLIAFFIILEWLFYKQKLNNKYILTLLSIIFVFLIILFFGTNISFIYFQF